MPIENWGGLSFKCKCGARHEIHVKEAALINDACGLVTYFGKKMGKRAHVVFDSAVVSEDRDKICRRLDKVFDYTVSVFESGGMPSLSLCEKVMSEAREETQIIICVGGADVCEYGKYASAASGLQWIFLCLIPDGDNMAAGYAYLFDGKVREILPGRAPDVFLCDTAMGYRYAMEIEDKAVAVILRNILTVFDSDFVVRTQGGKGCDVINYVLTNCVRQAVSFVKKPFRKDKARCLFDCVMRLSLAKSLCNVKTAYLTGIDAFTDALAAVGITDKAEADYTLASVYKAALESGFPLTTGKDVVAHAADVQKLFGVAVSPTARSYIDEEALKKNINRFVFNADLAERVTKTAVSGKTPPVWEVGKVAECLKVCSDLYAYGGLLGYISDLGLIDG